MLEEILRIDTELFLYLNNLGTSSFDGFWMFLSSKASNIIVYIAFLEFFLRIIIDYDSYTESHTESLP